MIFSIFAKNNIQMKKIPYLVLAIFIISCSSSDDDNGSIPIEETFNYFPLTSNTYWTYNNESDQGATRDSLYVAGIEETNGVINTVLGAEQPVTGFMTTLLSQSLVRTTTTKLILNGELGAPPVDGFPEITIPLDDVSLYDAEASNGELLSTITGEIEQVVNEIPLIITYTVSSIQGETLGSFQGFEEVLTSTIIINLAIVAEIEVLPGVVLPIPVLVAQDVMTISNYYANDIGLIFSENLIEYQLEDLGDIGIELPFPTEDSRTALQTIDTFEIGS